MEIRRDFAEVEPQLHRLLEFSKAFRQFNVQDWSHLANREDFDRIYTLGWEDKKPLENLYATGRDCASALSEFLSSFNHPDLHPTLSHFIHSLDGGWIYQQPQLEKIVQEAENKSKELDRTPWAIEQMIVLFRRQLEIIEAARNTIEILKGSDLYASENGVQETQAVMPAGGAYSKINRFYSEHPVLFWVIGLGISALLGLLAL
ncbi:hypothetical protein [uncultured Abyssibacter sp.]|uniref:hypothetical protein n=1 Tax=uncultured Abyssibacter sp. TaxID=2320202 RepID=UPI0032B178B2